MSQGFHHNKAKGLVAATLELIAQNELLRKGGDENASGHRAVSTLPAATIQPAAAGAITIEVKGTHIAGADVSARNCPTARAITDRIGKPCWVWTGRVRIGDKIYALPDECDGAEKGFTGSGRMLPYRFRLENKVVETAKSTPPASPAPIPATPGPSGGSNQRPDPIEIAWRLFDGQKIEVFNRNNKLIFAGNSGEEEKEWVCME